MNPLVRDRDVDFILYEVLDAPSLARLPYFADHSRATFDPLLANVRRCWSSRAAPALETLRKESWLDPREPCVVKPKTLLATTLWRRHGLLQPSESPRATARP